jgi:hypothetical protein
LDVAASTTAISGLKDTVLIPIEPGYRDFQWGLLLQTAQHDLVVSYSYKLRGQWQTHYFDVDSATDLAPTDAVQCPASI